MIVHPDYYQYSGETVIGQTDVALIKTASDLFGLNEDGTGTNDPMVEPICLPPKTGFMLDKNMSSLFFAAFLLCKSFAHSRAKKNINFASIV